MLKLNPLKVSNKAVTYYWQFDTGSVGVGATGAGIPSSQQAVVNI